MMGLVLAAGRSRRLQDLTTSRNKVLLDLGDGTTILENILDHFEAAGLSQTFVTAGHDANTVRRRCRDRASVLHNPFYESYGILSSLWVARPMLYATSFLATVGDHYFERDALLRFRSSQPDVPILLQVEMKQCDDEDMKVFIDSGHRLRKISKVWTKDGGSAIGEFTGMVRFSAAGSRLFFDTLAEFAWSHGVKNDVFMADVLMACHSEEPLAFDLSSDHRRCDIDYPNDYVRACELYRTRERLPEPEPAETPAEVTVSQYADQPV